MIKTNPDASTITLNTYGLNAPIKAQIFGIDLKSFAPPYMTITLPFPLFPSFPGEGSSGKSKVTGNNSWLKCEYKPCK